MTMKTPSLAEWISDILNHDPVTFEDAYWGRRPSTAEAVPAIIEQLDLPHDSYTRGKLIELLGECEDLSVMPILEHEIENPDESLREWAKGAIRALKGGEKWQQSPKYL